jgi:LEA14-like dessication related protein
MGSNALHYPRIHVHAAHMQQRRLVIAWLALVSLSACAHYKPVDVFVINLTPAEGSALEQRIKVDLRILNPNDEAIVANGMQIRLDVNGARLARGVSDATFTIPRLGEATTSIVATTTLFDLAKQIVAMSGGRQTFQYVLDGDIYLTGAGPLARSVSFHNAGEYPPAGAPVNQTGGRTLQ